MLARLLCITSNRLFNHVGTTQNILPQYNLRTSPCYYVLQINTGWNCIAFENQNRTNFPGKQSQIEPFYIEDEIYRLHRASTLIQLWIGMMTSSNGNIFRVTGHLCGEFTGPGEFPAHRPVTRSFGVLFDLHLNKRLSKQSWGWWFETQSCPVWRHCNGEVWILDRFEINGLCM